MNLSYSLSLFLTTSSVTGTIVSSFSGAAFITLKKSPYKLNSQCTKIRINDNDNYNLSSSLAYSSDIISTRATIFGWDEDSNSLSSTFDEPILQIDSFDGHKISNQTKIIERLSRDPENIASLARLAVAFSPPERSLRLDDISRVEVISVDEHHIEISAVVCDEEECVSLFVPVNFPHECGFSGAGADNDGEMEECVLDNLCELDSHAEGVIRDKEIHLKGDHSDEVWDQLCSLYSSGGVQFPTWWVAPHCVEGMVEECDTVQRLLNQDTFQNSVKALAERGLEAMDLEMDEHGRGLEVERAAVTCVGPAGFCLRARVRARKKVIEEQQLESERNDVDVGISLIDIPYSFGGEPVTDTQALRAAVLGAVASAEDLTP